MLTNKDSSSKKKDSKRGYFFSLFYVSLFGFIFLSGTMLGIIPSSLQTQPVSMGSQDVYAQQQYYPPPQKAYDDKSYRRRRKIIIVTLTTAIATRAMTLTIKRKGIWQR